MNTKVTVRIPAEIDKKLQEAARQRGTSVSTIIREAVTLHLRKQQEEQIFKDITPIEEKITGLIREEMKKVVHVCQSQIFNRLASLTVKSFLYSVATRKNTNYLIEKTAKDAETANQLIDKGWKLAVDALKKEGTIALFLNEENTEKLKSLGRDDTNNVLNEVVKEWLSNQEQKTPLAAAAGE